LRASDHKMNMVMEQLARVHFPRSIATFEASKRHTVREDAEYNNVYGVQQSLLEVSAN